MKKMLRCIIALLICIMMATPQVNVNAVTINRPSKTKPVDKDKEDYGDTEIDIDKKEDTEINKEDDKVIDIIKPADLVFIIDSTGSMYYDIQSVKNNVEEFSKYLESRGVDIRMAVIEYRDITCDGLDSTILHTVDYTPWHKNTDELKITLGNIEVDGGGDIPETLIDAMGYLLNEDEIMFRSDACKFAVVLTDATYKEKNRYDLTMDTLIKKLNEKNIITSVITADGNFSDYKDLVGEKGCFNIDGDYKEELKKVAEIIFDTKVIPGSTISVKKITITCDSKSNIKVGEKINLHVKFDPVDATNQNVKWHIDDDSILKLNVGKGKCTVEGLKEGSTTITAVSEDGGFTGTYVVNVSNSAKNDDDKKLINRGDKSDTEEQEEQEAITLSVNDMKVSPAKKTIDKNKSFTINVVANSKEFKELPEEEFDEILEDSLEAITYKSSKSSIVRVDKDGKVTGLKKGNAVISTKVALTDGSTKTFKTKVYVK